MVKTRAQELMYNISEILYRNGKYGMERIAIICEIISKLMHSIGWDNNLNFDRKHFDNIINKLIYELNISSFLQNIDKNQFMDLFIYLIKEDKQDIANAIKQLVENDKKSSNIIPTDDFSVKVMQAFAKKMYKGGTYIDPCVGTGRLLAGLGADKYYGFDIDINALKISETYLNLIERISDRTRLDIKISAENFLYRKFGLIDNIYNPTYIFDPPLNDSIEMSPLLENTLSRVGIYSLGKYIPSEYAFLTRVLFEANKDICNFVCIVSNSFLSATDKFKSSFRRYLMENSIIAVIQSNFSANTKTQKLILVGKSRLDSSAKRPIYFITPKNENIKINDIEKIAQRCIIRENISEDEFYDIAKIKMCTLQELRELNYEISMPRYVEGEINPKEIESLDKIINNLKKLNEKLNKKSLDIESFLENLLNGNKNDIELVQSNVNVPKNTRKGKKWYEIEQTDDAVVLNIIMQNANIIDEPSKNLYQVEFNIIDYDYQTLFQALKDAMDNGRLSTECNKFYVNTSKTVKNEKNEINLIDLMCKFNEKKLQYLSKKQINIYKLLINYYLTSKYVECYPKTDYPIKIEDFSNNELFSALYTLKTLGVIQENKYYIQQNKDSIDLRNIDILSHIYNPFKGVVYFDYSCGGIDV